LGLGFLAAGCNGTMMATNDTPDMSQSVIPYSGGTIPINGCSESVTTRDGANAPVYGSAKLGSDPTPWGVHLGLAGDPSTSMVVSWRTKDEETLATTVQWGTGGKTDQSTDGITFDYQASGSTNTRIHETHLCGLQPGTTYSYRVGGKDASGTEKWSDVYTFHTAPAKGDATKQVVFAVIGDTRDDVAHYAKWGELIEQAQTMGAPDLILFNGDAVVLGPIQSQWDDWFRVAEPVLRSVPLISSHGNHEANAVNYYSQFAMPGDEQYFSVDYGNAHIAVINDSPESVPDDLTTKAKAFFMQDLAAATAPWKFAMHHKATFSSCSGHGSDMTLRGLFQPVFDDNKVDVVFNGHDHDYERTKPREDYVKDGRPTTYIVAGGGGAPTRAMKTSDFTAAAKAANHFLGVTLDGDRLVGEAIDDVGNPIDSFSIQR
jgi:hypothetical protein